jgi:hypothetical protein
MMRVSASEKTRLAGSWRAGEGEALQSRVVFQSPGRRFAETPRVTARISIVNHESGRKRLIDGLLG